MPYRLMADLVVVVHLAFIVFVGVGALLAWRWRRLFWPHVASVVWAVAGIAAGVPCPLTPLEKLLRRRAGEDTYAGGFVDHYVEGVLYPEALTPLLWTAAGLAVVVGYAGLYRRRLGDGPEVRPVVPLTFLPQLGRRRALGDQKELL